MPRPISVPKPSTSAQGFNKTIVQKTMSASSKLLTTSSIEEMLILNSALSILSIASNFGDTTEAQRLVTMATKLIGAKSET